MMPRCASQPASLLRAASNPGVFISCIPPIVQVWLGDSAGPSISRTRVQRRFTICMTDASHITLLPKLLAHVRALAPGVVLSASHIDNQLAQALRNGDANLALGFLPWLDTGFTNKPCMRKTGSAWPMPTIRAYLTRPPSTGTCRSTSLRPMWA